MFHKSRKTSNYFWFKKEATSALLRKLKINFWYQIHNYDRKRWDVFEKKLGKQILGVVILYLTYTPIPDGKVIKKNKKLLGSLRYSGIGTNYNSNKVFCWVIIVDEV